MEITFQTPPNRCKTPFQHHQINGNACGERATASESVINTMHWMKICLRSHQMNEKCISNTTKSMEITFETPPNQWKLPLKHHQIDVKPLSNTTKSMEIPLKHHQIDVKRLSKTTKSMETHDASERQRASP